MCADELGVGRLSTVGQTCVSHAALTTQGEYELVSTGLVARLV